MQVLIRRSFLSQGLEIASTTLLGYNRGTMELIDKERNSTVLSATFQLSEQAIAIWEKLDAFKALEPNWDSYGAAAPALAAIEAAINFVKEMDRYGMPFYFVAPGRDGEVMLEFKGDIKRAAEVYFNADGSTEVLLFEQEDCILESTLQKDKRALISFFNG